MTANFHQFRASVQPTEKHLHCLWNVLTNKAFNNANPEFKIIPNGKLIGITTSLSIPVRDVVLDDLSFKYLRSNQIESTLYSTGLMVHAQGNLCYSMHSTKTKKDLCPVGLDGELRKDTKLHFLTYLTQSTGLDFIAADKEGHLNFSREDRSIGYEDKVRLNDIIIFDITTTVVDNLKVNSLPFRAIGRRKSYGFGHVSINHAAALE